MQNKESSASTDLDLFVKAGEWPIDLDEVRARVDELLTLMESKMIPLAREYEYWMRVRNGMHERQRIARERDSFLRQDIGIVAPPEASLRPEQPCLLVWNTSFSTCGDEYIPVLIEIARMVSPAENPAEGIVLDVLPLCEISINHPQPRRLDFYRSRDFHRRVVSNQSKVIAPLHLIRKFSS